MLKTAWFVKCEVCFWCCLPWRLGQWLAIGCWDQGCCRFVVIETMGVTIKTVLPSQQVGTDTGEGNLSASDIVVVVVIVVVVAVVAVVVVIIIVLVIIVVVVVVVVAT